MKLKTKYILFVSALHLVFLLLSYLTLKDKALLFILSEVVILFSVLLSIWLYRQLIEPIEQIKAGINAIQDKDFNVRLLTTGKNEVDELIRVYNRMMDALREERTRQEAQHFFLEKLIATSPTGIVILDFNEELKQMNPKASSLMAGNEAQFMAFISSLKAGESRVWRMGNSRSYKIQKSHFMDRGFPRLFVMIEELTAEISQAEKNTYSKVIRMMAHEVNNTIGPVNSIINLALSNEGLWSRPAVEPVKNALSVAVERNQNLNVFMRNFADLVKLTPAKKHLLDLRRIVENVANFLQPMAAQHEVVFRSQLGAEPFLINADAQQMEQVLLNVTKNAIEAIGSGGRVSFILDAEARSLSITDNGKGLSNSSNEQLFSPFFSTKKDGQGIGLTLVKEILQYHGFDFSLKSEEAEQSGGDLKTSFMIFFS
ncbi:sensor histidine kinase [Pedobacter sp. GR22-6]|uniref:sensor histidine kinase n=1 Tax=Pedobacter sp. GR22-6 TaxID=3127957 RepID=UPI00307E1454